MIQIKSELSKVLGKIEELDHSSLTSGNLYPLIERAYLLISDSFDIEQCHSTIHHLVMCMKELKDYDKSENKSSAEEEKILNNARLICAEELRIFISHL